MCSGRGKDAFPFASCAEMLLMSALFLFVFPKFPALLQLCQGEKMVASLVG